MNCSQVLVKTSHTEDKKVLRFWISILGLFTFFLAFDSSYCYSLWNLLLIFLNLRLLGKYFILVCEKRYSKTDGNYFLNHQPSEISYSPYEYTRATAKISSSARYLRQRQIDSERWLFSRVAVYVNKTATAIWCRYRCRGAKLQNRLLCETGFTRKYTPHFHLKLKTCSWDSFRLAKKQYWCNLKLESSVLYIFYH